MPKPEEQLLIAIENKDAEVIQLLVMNFVGNMVLMHDEETGETLVKMLEIYKPANVTADDLKLRILTLKTPFAILAQLIVLVTKNSATIEQHLAAANYVLELNHVVR